AGLCQQPRAGLLLDLAPQLVRASDERDVLGALADGETGDPRVPVRGPVWVRRLVLVDPDDASSAPCQLKDGRAAHRTPPPDDDVGLTRSDRATVISHPRIERFGGG